VKKLPTLTRIFSTSERHMWKMFDRQARFWRRRPDGFTVNEQEHIIYVLEFKRVSDAGQEYVTESQQLAEAQHLAVTQGLQKLFKDT
jgi:hypothetical protein